LEQQVLADPSSEKPTTTQREKLEAKESAILAAAHREFAEMGFDGAKMAAIARRASVAEGTIYLYYRNKAELLERVVARFWSALTEGALAAIPEQSPAIEQLMALARYHLTEVVNDFDFIGFTSQVRQKKPRDDRSLDPIRRYVRVFDAIYRRGVDRGEFSANTECRHWRDLFYGQLEYAARTMVLRNSNDTDSVMAHLEHVLRAGLAQPRLADSPQQTHEEDLGQLLAAMKRDLERLEQAIQPKTST
jgi:TetR/AcrR family fatty acid metabolism transcriptional regulator